VAAFDAVFFDLDGTLCRRTQDTDAMYERAFDRAEEPSFGDPEDLWAALEGPPDHDDTVGYFAAGFTRVAAQHGRPDADTLALARALLSVIDDGAVTFLPGAEEAVTRAAAIGRIGIVTNGPEHRQRAKLEALGIVERFDVIVYAADLPRSKPHALPFERALDVLDVAPEDALHVGDSLGYDVAGAQNAGLSAAWLRGNADADAGAYEPEYVIDSLAELPAVLEGTR